MPQDKSVALERIKQLVDEGEFGDALPLISDFEERGDISLYNKLSCNLLKCDLLYQQGLFQEAIQLAERIY
ncbi:MAG: hypothetical protein ACFFG0_08935, partial [Candidatus Thorarchaeota archaeon]